MAAEVKPPEFIVYVSGDYLMTVEDIWPDGDAPESPTASDVAEAMREYGPKNRTLRDWALLDDLDVSVDSEDVR